MRWEYKRDWGQEGMGGQDRKNGRGEGERRGRLIRFVDNICGLRYEVAWTDEEDGWVEGFRSGDVRADEGKWT